MLDGAAAANNT